LSAVRPEHYAACHFAEDALRSDVGVAHMEEKAESPAGTAAAGTAAATA
jgi:hypothetical protein